MMDVRGGRDSNDDVSRTLATVGHAKVATNDVHRWGGDGKQRHTRVVSLIFIRTREHYSQETSSAAPVAIPLAYPLQGGSPSDLRWTRLPKSVSLVPLHLGGRTLWHAVWLPLHHAWPTHSNPVCADPLHRRQLPTSCNLYMQQAGLMLSNVQSISRRSRLSHCCDPHTRQKDFTQAISCSDQPDK